jgi:hypothetical protein
MKFRLLTSSHADESGRSYEKGAIIESSKDLVAMFGKEKFEAVSSAVAATAPAAPPAAKKEPQSSAPAAEVDTVETKEVEPVESELGENVTAKFPTAQENGLIVLHKGKKYFVADEGTPNEKLNTDDDLKNQSEVEDWLVKFVGA